MQAMTAESETREQSRRQYGLTEYCVVNDQLRAALLKPSSFCPPRWQLVAASIGWFYSVPAR